MNFSNIDFNVRYIDPSSPVNGDGSSPVTPMNNFPASIDELSNNTAWIIRRTSEEYSVLLPHGATSIQNILFIGMPKPSDPMWSMMPRIAQEAWSDDLFEYANIKADTGTDPWGEEWSFRMDDGKTFLLHRCYVFRENTPAYNTIFKFPSQNYIAEISIENCKFGYKGINIDSEDYVDDVSSVYGCRMYLHVNTAHVFSMHHCIINLVNTYNDYYMDTPNPINVNNANFFTVSDIDVYTTTSEHEEGYGVGTALNFSNGSWGGAYSDYQNLRFHILPMKEWGYLPMLFYSAVNDFCKIRNVTITLESRQLGTGTPTRYSVSQSLFRTHGSREFMIENITVNLPKCWRINSGGRVVSISGFANSTIPGHCKSIKNITINMAETDGIDTERNGNYYDWVRYGTTDIGQYPYYSALEMSFSEYSYYEGAWEPVVASGITVNHPRGVALYAYGCQIRNCDLKGAIKLRRCVADVGTLESFYPGYALFAAEATTLRVGYLILGKDNTDITGGADDPAVGSRYSDNSFIYVESSNGALKSNIGETVTNVWNGYNFICSNEMDTGHYTCRSCNYLCDTWNARRTDGAPAVWKFTSSANGSGGLSLGRAPFKGLQLPTGEVGNYTLTMHIAAKGISDISAINRSLLVQVTVPRPDNTEEVLFSSTSGQWLDDSESEWVNDSELVQKKLVIPFQVTQAISPIDVKIHYQLYSATGYVYIDPAMEISTIQ